MPRPVKYRKIGQMPVYRSFSPDDAENAETVRMTVDEFETVKLLDGSGLTQEACASRMCVSRTTVTAIYDSARKKIADALVHGKQLLIVGGCCEYEPIEINRTITMKGSNVMRIAVTYQNGEVFQHFGQTEQFKLYDVEDGKIVKEQVVDTDGIHHGALAGFLKAAKADVLICGGIGTVGREALAEVDIKLYPGVQGSADAAAKALADGTLQYDPAAQCDHHHGHHGGCGHHAEGGHEYDDEECNRRRVEGECARDNGECDHHHGHHGGCGHHAEGGHEYGDEECNRRRIEGECARDNGECGHHHGHHEGECGHHCRKN